MMKAKVNFTKMQGAGNDFIVMDNRTTKYTMAALIDMAPILCNRKYGVGSDGLLVLNPPDKQDVDFTMVYRNADGSDAGMCGNGARCLSLFAHRHDFNAQHSFNVHDNIYRSEVHNNDDVTIKFPVEVHPAIVKTEDRIWVRADTGTEHLVTFCTKDFLEEEKELIELGRKIRYADRFDPPGTNVNFVFQDSSDQILLQTYERGVENLTLACGTGALASSVADHFIRKEKNIPNHYLVKVKGGNLKTHFIFDPENNVYTDLQLSGPAQFVFEGAIEIDL